MIHGFFHMNDKDWTAVFAGALSFGATWFATVFASSLVVDKLHDVIIAGNYVQDSWTFYSNAHLLEETYEGTYHPLLDPVFVLSILVTSIPSFFVGAFVSRLIASANIKAALFVTAVIGILFVIAPLDRDWHSSRLLQTAVFEAVVIVCSVIGGIYVGKRIKDKRPTELNGG
jgi:hypothetical protein